MLMCPGFHAQAAATARGGRAQPQAPLLLVLGETAASHGAAGGFGLVEPPHRQRHRRVAQRFRVVLRLPRRPAERLDRRSRASRDSVSVGSTISASSTMSGKYVVGGCTP